MSVEVDEEELYADLYEDLEDGRQVPKTAYFEMEERVGQLTKLTEDMQAKVDALQKQKDSLQRDKDVLIRNISCLFKTAQLEIARKNKQINELREELSQMKPQEGHPKSLTATEAQRKSTSEELSRDSNLNKIQNSGCRETRRLDILPEVDSSKPYDLMVRRKDSGDRSTHQIRLIESNIHDKSQTSRDSPRPRTVEAEKSNLEGTCNAQQVKDSFNDPCENRNEIIRFRHDKLREWHSQEKLVQKGFDNGNEQPAVEHRKKDGTHHNEFRDYQTTGRMGRDADRTSLRTATNGSRNRNRIFSGDDHYEVSRNSGVKRKVTDAVNTAKQDSYNDLPSYKTKKMNSFIHKSDQKRHRNVDGEFRRTERL